MTTTAASTEEDAVSTLMQTVEELDAAELYFLGQVVRAMVERRPRRAVRAARDLAKLHGKEVPPEILRCIRAAATRQAV